MKHALGRGLDILDRVVEAIIALAFAAMLLIGGLEVFCRFVLHNSQTWSDECQRYLHIWVIFLAIPLGYQRGAHIGMNIVIDRLPGPLRRGLRVLIDMLWLTLGGFIVYHTRTIMQVAANQTSSALRLRMSWIYAGLLLGGAYLCLMALRKLWGHLRPAPATEKEA